ncbi:hypothetical protein AGMMS49991_10660 [Spirochaetia bacterium]|nr:hypothetical protein AGMMS49991_10660 [Spirochaetia bacterium]
MKNFKKLTLAAAALIVTAFFITGCNNDPVHVELTGLSIDLPVGVSDPVIRVGGTPLQLTVVVVPSDATNKKVTWETGNPAVATVSDTGLVTLAETAVPGNSVEISVVSQDNPAVKETRTITVLAGYVTGVAITPAADLTLTVGDVSDALSSAVLPAGADQTVTWHSSDETVATAADGVVTAVKAGEANITAKSVGLDGADGSVVTSNAVKVTVSDPVPALVLYNQGTPAAGTSTAVPAANANGRIIIKNENPTAGFSAGAAGSGNGGVVDSTIVYWNIPLTETVLSISARVRITSRLAEADGGNNTTGVIMGALADPKGDIRFAGFRDSSIGLKRFYYSRANNTNSSSAMTAANSSGYTDNQLVVAGVDTSSINGDPIPYDEEFILKTERTSATTYTITLSDGVTGAAVAAYTRTSGIDPLLLTSPVYIGFIVSGVEVEISQIEIKSGAAVIFSTPATTPTPVVPQSVQFTAPAAAPGEGYDLEVSRASGTLSLSARVLPAKAPQDITWFSSAPATASVQTLEGASTTITLLSAGTVTITATAKNTSPAVSKGFIVKISESDILVTGITASAAGGKTSIMAGDGGSHAAETLQFSADVDPDGATNKTVTWSVSDSSTYASTITAAGGSINASTGLLTATNNLVTDTDIWVFAAASDASGLKSTGVKVTVKPYSAGPVIPLYKANIGAANGSVSYNADTQSLSVSGTGAINTTGQVFSFVYTETSGDFTMTVELSSITWGQAGNNAGRVGIIAIPKTTPISSVPTDNTLLFGGAAIRGDASKVRHQRTTSGSNSGTSTISLSTDANYLRLRRVGSNIFAAMSTDGTTWVEAGSTNPVLGTDVYVGLEVSNNNASLTTAVFKNLRIALGNGNATADGDFTAIDLSQTIANGL